MKVYYNENDKRMCAWLRQLMIEELIPKGDIDDRDIREVRAADVAGYDQQHYFAGIGGWPLALRRAGWGDRPCWTGSAPCQPYSSAGSRLGDADERNLWPHFYRLIDSCRPPIIFGEQVASADVVGPSGQDESVQEVQDREAVFGVLHELKGKQKQHMQGLREGERARPKAQEPRTDSGSVQGVEGRQPRLCACERRQASSEEAWHGIRSGPGGHPESDRGGEVRDMWDRLLAFGPSRLEFSILGPNGQFEGIHEGEHQSRLVCPECHGEYLGPREDFGDCVGDHESPLESIERLIRRDQRASERDSPVWLDGILGAHSVGAPHIRQRLFWMAHSHRAGLGQGAAEPRQRGISAVGGAGVSVGVADREGERCGEGRRRIEDTGRAGESGGLRAGGGMADTDGGESGDGGVQRGGQQRQQPQDGGVGRLADTAGDMGLGRQHESEWGSDRRTADRRIGEGPERMGDAASGGCGVSGDAAQQGDSGHAIGAGGAGHSGLGDANDAGLQGLAGDGAAIGEPGRISAEPLGLTAAADPVDWRASRFIWCRDEKIRRVPLEPSLFPLVAGLSGRVGVLRGAGNAIVPEVAARFIRACRDVIDNR